MTEKEQKRELVCISCPVGCSLEAVLKDDGSLEVTGNQCPKGEEYAREEINAPKRIVTTTVAVRVGRLRVPVRTDKSLPIEHIGALLAKLHGMKLKTPLRRGDVVIKDFEDTGVNVVASLSMEE